jgi:hypothetical protein
VKEGEEMELSRMLAKISTKQQKAEADYLKEMAQLRKHLQLIEGVYQKNNSIDRVGCERLIESAFRVYGNARRVEELRELAEELAEELAKE